MHLFVAVDGGEGQQKDFPRFLHSIPLKDLNGTWTTRCVCREVRLYDIIVDERNLEDLIPILKTHEKVSLSGRAISSAISLISKFFPFLSPFDTSKYPRHGGERDKVWWREQIGGTPPYMMFLGYVPDIKNEKGEDML